MAFYYDFKTLGYDCSDLSNLSQYNISHSPTTLASWISLEYYRRIPASEILHLLFPLSGMLFSQVSTKLAFSPPSSLYLNVTFSLTLSLDLCLKLHLCLPFIPFFSFISLFSSPNHFTYYIFFKFSLLIVCLSQNKNVSLSFNTFV